MAKGTYAVIVLTGDDVDAAFDQLGSRGAEVVQEPVDQPYGLRDRSFRDPAGNPARINQPL